jgi:hypothetical protein
VKAAHRARRRVALKILSALEQAHRASMLATSTARRALVVDCVQRLEHAKALQDIVLDEAARARGAGPSRRRRGG